MATLPSDLSTANVSQLKDYLRHRNLPRTGSKPILVKRLEQHHRESTGSSPPSPGLLWHPDQTYLMLLIRIDAAEVFQKYIPHLRKAELRQWLYWAIYTGSAKIAIKITRRLQDYSLAISQAVGALVDGSSKSKALGKMLQKWIHDGGLPVVNLGLIESARRNAIDLTHFFLEHGATAFDEAASIAEAGGYLELLELIRNQPTLAKDLIT